MLFDFPGLNETREKLVTTIYGKDGDLLLKLNQIFLGSFFT